MKTISIELSEKSINAAIAEIEAYKQAIDRKLNQLVRKLADIGSQTAHGIMMGVAPVDRGNDYSEPTVEPIGENAYVIKLHGEQVMFIEFSAGITFGTNSFPSLPNNPSYGQGYGMGTYPSDKGHWDDPTGWWYKGTWNEWEHTYGIRAYAPMYHADVEMRNQLNAIAKEVFGG